MRNPWNRCCVRHFLVPKLSLGTRGKKLCFAWFLSLERRNEKLRFGYKIHLLRDRQKATTAMGRSRYCNCLGDARLIEVYTDWA